MKILFINLSFNITGGNKAVFEVANRLSDRGYNVELMALGGGHSWYNVRVPVKYLLKNFMNTTLKFYSLIKPKSRYVGIDGNRNNDLIKRINSIIKTYLSNFLVNNIHDADVVIFTYYLTAFSFKSLRHRQYKTFYFVQDFPEFVIELDGYYGLKLFDLTLRLPFDAFLANSSYARDLILQRQPGARVFVTGISIDTNVFKPRRDGIVDVGGKYRVMVILRPESYKGSDVAVKVLNEVSRRLPIHALIVGERAFIESLLRSMNANLTYTVFSKVPDDLLARVYNSADALLYTSYVEGFGLPPLEAMASGTPVVTTDCLGNRDYIVHGFNALVCSPGDVECLTNSLIKVLTDDKLREELIKNGLETAKQWTWDKVVDKFKEAIKGVMG